MDYRQAWQYLDDLQFFKIKLGLDSMRRLLGELGNPERDLRFLHIGGTNGKGSVGVTLLAALAEAGLRVGFYTSPHLSCVRERFRINDTFMDEDTFARLLTRVREVLGDRQITYFECTTALALLWFAEQEVDCAIMEVGMGGRLDATNVIVPELCVITNVAMDHEAHLGDTITQIAAEKAGIVKSGVPVVTGAADEVLAVIEARCRELKAPLFRLGREFGIEAVGDRCRYSGFGPFAAGLADLRIGLAGRHQRDNTAVALAALEILVERGFVSLDAATIRRAVAGVRWPGRMEELVVPVPDGDGRSRRFLLDGAHNPAGVAMLCEHLARYRQSGGRVVLLWGAMADKNLADTLPVVARSADRLVVTGMPYERAADPARLRDLVADLPTPVDVASDVSAGITLAAGHAGDRDLVCIAGSLYLVGAARRLLVGELV